jgi:hypothetical protein
MLAACRLAGLSALETYYAGVKLGAPPAASPRSSSPTAACASTGMARPKTQPTSLDRRRSQWSGAGDGRFILPRRSQFKGCKMVFTV